MPLPHDDDSLYTALMARDPAYDGFAYVGVNSTGIFCRLTCPARRPKRASVVFFRNTVEAQAAGFRACRRCRPLDPQPPASRALEALREQVKAAPDRRWTTAALAALGLDPSTVRRAFKREYGVTFAQYARSQRLGLAAATLRDGASVLDAQLDAGYESGSGFREAIAKLLGAAPVQARGRGLLTAQWLLTPIGPMLAVAGDGGVHLLEFADRRALPTEIARLRARHGPVCFGRADVLDALSQEVAGYFAGRSVTFAVPLVQRGTPFETAVWAALREVPPGQTRSYTDIARAIGRPTAVRAVARANGANQIAIIVPCHRVIGANGAMVGYGGKVWRKQWLLEHERRLATREEDRDAGHRVGAAPTTP
jgi:AraC family transcriptional regulator, regulatory protein of adaptative response / methylated-DNA-[protein]-cysteine methyltransferase